VDRQEGVDIDGDVDMERDGDDKEEEDEEEEDTDKEDEEEEEDEDADEDDGKEPWTISQGGMVNTSADDVDIMVDDQPIIGNPFNPGRESAQWRSGQFGLAILYIERLLEQREQYRFWTFS